MKPNFFRRLAITLALALALALALGSLSATAATITIACGSGGGAVWAGEKRRAGIGARSALCPLLVADVRAQRPRGA